MTDRQKRQRREAFSEQIFPNKHLRNYFMTVLPIFFKAETL